MFINEKIRIMRKNHEWTHSELAEKMSVTPDIVQAWEDGKGLPSVTELKHLCDLFGISADLLLNDEADVVEYIKTETIPGSVCRGDDSGEHTVYDGSLKRGAKLHRFLNCAGAAYSAIYENGQEKCSCERQYETQMVMYWNKNH